MKIIKLSYPPAAADEPIPLRHIMAVGDFDGVHKGHQDVIGHVIRLAREQGAASSIMTFHPHPREVLGQEKYAQWLSPLEQKLALFTDLGIDYTFLVSFDLPFSRISPEQFASEMLFPLHMQSLVVGFDFAFGFQGKGSPALLMQLAKPLGVKVEIVEPYHQEGKKVSSSTIREQLESGELEKANTQLGRPYSLQGLVVHGEGRGKKLNYPTANIDVDRSFVLPHTGVYAVRMTVCGQKIGGVMNFGYKPTFHEQLLKPSLEVHLFDFNRTIYGETVKVELLAYLRSERKFTSIDQLIAQIGNDVETAKKVLGNESHSSFTL